MNKIGNKLYTFLAVSVVLLALIGIFINYQFQKKAIENTASYQLSKYKNELNSYIEYEAKMMESFLQFISQNNTLQNSFEKQDKKQLFSDSKDIYRKLNTQNNITHFYFIKTDGTAFLRVHDFSRDSDIINRYTLNKAIQTKQLSYGIEFGLKKNYTLRVVYPWIVDKKIIGYIELGKEIDKVINHLSKQLNMDIFFAVDKKEYKNSPKFIQKRLESYLQTKQYYIVYQTNNSNNNILDFIQRNKNETWLKFKDNQYIGYIDTLEDVSMKKLGKTLFLVNVSQEYQELKNSLYAYAFIMGSGTFFMLLVGFLLAVKKQKVLDTTLSELVNEKNKVQDSIQEKNNLLSLFDKGDSVLFKWNNDEKWSIDYVSKNVENLLGYSKDEFLSSNILYSDCIHKDDIDQVLIEVQEAKNEHKEFFKHKPYRIITKDQETKWVLDYTVLQKDSDNETTHFLGYLIDITEQENFRKNLEKFIETQENIVILTNGKEITFANQSFFNFLGYKDLNEFKIDHACICEHFIENDRFFHLGKVPDGENWVEFILSLPHSERIVLIMGKKFSPHAFSISINQFNQDLMIISFADISQTILEHIKLEDKTIHDKLTNAFNREYFEQNYKRLIYEYEKENSHLALALLDIDHFKKVNDTYGHDVGDQALIHFVKTIHKFSRENDILIRWGGEEFILVLKINSLENLEKALNHIRKVIEIQNFPTIGQKTCSIGGTIYKKSETIETTIKRADEAVYEAKSNGRNNVVIKP